MAARCSITRGAGNTLGCCRVAGHPTDNGPAEHAGCCMHWSAFIRGVPMPHTLASRAASGRALGCAKGAALDCG